MGKYIGDAERGVLHRVDDLNVACLENAMDARRVIDVHSEEFAEYLLRSEKWHVCDHCRPFTGMAAFVPVAGGPPVDHPPFEGI